MNLVRSALHGAAAAVFCAVAGQASAVVVSAFDPAFVANGRWFESDVRPGGGAAVVDLASLGGNLESGQPLPTGAARLTTDATNAAKAEVAVVDAYGTVAQILSSLELHYAYYKVGGAPAEPAPAIKLTFFNGGYAGDGFVTLVYEPYWNQPSAPGSSVAPPADQWNAVDIDFDTGLFWQTGGFGQAGSAGGPPLRTLEGWASTFDAGFQDAELLWISMGIGTFNPGQTTYFDDVRVGFTRGTSGQRYSAVYDFEPAAAAVPEPGSLALLGLGAFGLAALRRRHGA